jgi:hypothetical protein
MVALGTPAHGVLGCINQRRPVAANRSTTNISLGVLGCINGGPWQPTTATTNISLGLEEIETCDIDRGRSLAVVVVATTISSFLFHRTTISQEQLKENALPPS